MQFGIAEWDDEDFAAVAGCCVQVYGEPVKYGAADVECRVGDNIYSFYTENLEYENRNLYKNVPRERLERMRDSANHEQHHLFPGDFEDATEPWDGMSCEGTPYPNGSMAAHNYKGP